MSAFKNKTVFITGASSGIGAALAREFAKRGAKVGLVARRSDRIETIAGEIQTSGGKAAWAVGDVTKDGSLEKAASKIRKSLGRLDAVVANAGFSVVGDVAELKIEDFRRQLETNTFGVLRTVYATLDDLKKSKGVLAIVGSVAGHVSSPGNAAYNMSKYAVRALAESLYTELRPFGIGVVLLTPGFIETEIRFVDNSGKFHADETDAVPAWIRMPAEKAARVAIRAMAARRPEAVITYHGKLAVFLSRVAPWLIRFIFLRSHKAIPKANPSGTPKNSNKTQKKKS